MDRLYSIAQVRRFVFAAVKVRPDTAAVAPMILQTVLFARGVRMKVAFQLIACWVLFSCLVAPCLTWAFFRRYRAERDRHNLAQQDERQPPSSIVIFPASDGPANSALYR